MKVVVLEEYLLSVPVDSSEKIKFLAKKFFHFLTINQQEKLEVPIKGEIHLIWIRNFTWVFLLGYVDEILVKFSYGP